MCGISGIFRNGSGDPSVMEDCIARMSGTLAHRGPDASDVWADRAAGIAFGHRRLSVLDLTAAGAQPMHSDCGRFTVTFNGEIYNHLDIRSELETAGNAPNWKGHSDTETLLYAVRYWGIEAALQRFNGMFAFAIWDAHNARLTLCRDRFGEKPLFYGWIGSDLVFASELKAFVAHHRWAGTVDRGSLTAFMRYSYVPTPRTIWEGIRKLDPGSSVTFSREVEPGNLPPPEPYWSMRQCVMSGQSEPGQRCCRRYRRARTIAIAGSETPTTFRRACGSVSIRRYRFLDDRCVDAGAGCLAGQDIFDRLC